MSTLVGNKNTFFEKNIDPNTKTWFLFDAKGQTLGRLATQIADVIRGKHKRSFTPHVDTGDFAVVVNASEIKLTGNKLSEKVYYKHTGFISGIKTRTAGQLKDKNPEELIHLAVWGMIPKGKLGRTQFGKLKVYAGAEHPHKAQNVVAYKAPEKKIKK